jgi:hypothetical protein
LAQTVAEHRKGLRAKVVRYVVDERTLTYVAVLYYRCTNPECENCGDQDLTRAWSFCPLCGTELREDRVNVSAWHR